MDVPAKMTPETMPIQCRAARERPTMAPASCRVGEMAKAVGATTKEKKISPPSQATSDRSMKNRRAVIRVPDDSDFVLSRYFIAIPVPGRPTIQAGIVAEN